MGRYSARRIVICGFYGFLGVRDWGFRDLKRCWVILFYFCVENWFVDSMETFKVQCDLGAAEG